MTYKDSSFASLALTFLAPKSPLGIVKTVQWHKCRYLGMHNIGENSGVRPEVEFSIMQDEKNIYFYVAVL